MTPQECLESVRTARQRIRTVERELLTPRADSWERCSPEIESAAVLVAKTEQELRDAAAGLDIERRSELRNELIGLRRDLRRVNALAIAAIEHYQAWSQLLGLAFTGYSAEGRVIPFTAPVQLCVEG
jgi:hypothetical protein